MSCINSLFIAVELNGELFYSSGSFNFLEHTILLDSANGLLPADQLIILAEVDVYPEPVGKFGNEFLLAKLTWEAKENAAESLEALLNSEDQQIGVHHSDVVLVQEFCKDEEDYFCIEDLVNEFAAHKNILSLHSPVLAAMFKSEPVEGNEAGRIRIPETGYFPVQKMLEFVYTGYVDFEDFGDIVEELYETTDKVNKTGVLV